MPSTSMHMVTKHMGIHMITLRSMAMDTSTTVRSSPLLFSFEVESDHSHDGKRDENMHGTLDGQTRLFILKTSRSLRTHPRRYTRKSWGDRLNCFDQYAWLEEKWSLLFLYCCLFDYLFCLSITETHICCLITKNSFWLWKEISTMLCKGTVLRSSWENPFPLH